MKRFIISKLAMAFAAVFLASSFVSFTGTTYAADTDQQKLDKIKKGCLAIPDFAFKETCEKLQNELKASKGCSGTMFEKYKFGDSGVEANVWKYKFADVYACQDKISGQKNGTAAKDARDNALRHGERLTEEFQTKCVDNYSDNTERCNEIIAAMQPICSNLPERTDGSPLGKAKLLEYVTSCKEAVKNGGSSINEDNETVDCDMKLASPLSWIACPIIDMGVGFTDFVFEDFVQPMLEQVPVSTNPEDGVYKAWAQFRFIANLLLIASLLAIVYSQARGAK